MLSMNSFVSGGDPKRQDQPVLECCFTEPQNLGSTLSYNNRLYDA
jgi:hypothetical protein